MSKRTWCIASTVNGIYIPVWDYANSPHYSKEYKGYSYEDALKKCDEMNSKIQPNFKN